MKKTIRLIALAGIIATCVAAVEPLYGLDRKQVLVPFETFYQGILNARQEDYSDRKGYSVKNHAAFGEMKNHVISFYEGIQVRESFLDGDHAVDCIPIDQQPSLKAPGMEGHALQIHPPILPSRFRDVGDHLRFEEKNDDPEQLARIEGPRDSLGNVMKCPVGFVPWRRLELADITHYQSLSAFLRKNRESPNPADSRIHRHAVGYQSVRNIGAGAYLNIWSPQEVPGEASISQIWILSGAIGSRDLQTAEAGWMVDRAKYHTSDPKLFTFWTTASHLNGCYNGECKAFMQVDQQWFPGKSMPVSSARGGFQSFYGVDWYRDPKTGNWWLYLTDLNASPVKSIGIGYYPRELYRGGEMFKQARLILFGGEVVAALGQVETGEMGSGLWPTHGLGYAASQQGIHRFQSKGTINTWAPVTLTPIITNPGCYSMQLFNNPPRGGVTYFYFGGRKCPAVVQPPS